MKVRLAYVDATAHVCREHYLDTPPWFVALGRVEDARDLKPCEVCAVCAKLAKRNRGGDK